MFYFATSGTESDSANCRYSPSMSSVQDEMKNGILASKHPLEAAHHAMHEMHLPHWLQQTSHATMLHAIVPATRTDGKEAIAFVTPVSGVSVPLQTLILLCKIVEASWQTTWHSCAGNVTAQAGACAAIKVASALLHYLSQAQWLAKDIIWLVVDDDCALRYDRTNAKHSKQHAAKVRFPESLLTSYMACTWTMQHACCAAGRALPGRIYSAAQE